MTHRLPRRAYLAISAAEDPVTAAAGATGTGRGEPGYALLPCPGRSRPGRRRPQYDPGTMSSAPGPTIQVFGLLDSRPTQAALRFFRERRVAVHVVDLRKRPIAAGELRRFVERLGARALADEESRAWRDAGLGYLRMDDAELVERLLADPRLLRLPLVRNGPAVTAGPAETTWKAWLAAGASAGRATSPSSRSAASGASR